MDRQIVDPRLNIIIQRGDLFAAVQIVARLRIVMLDETVLSLKVLVQF